MKSKVLLSVLLAIGAGGAMAQTGASPAARRK